MRRAGIGKNCLKLGGYMQLQVFLFFHVPPALSCKVKVTSAPTHQPGRITGRLGMNGKSKAYRCFEGFTRTIIEAVTTTIRRFRPSYLAGF